MVRFLPRLVLVVMLVVLGAAPAAAQTGECTVLFNGVEAARIDSLNSPLELDTEDTLIFQGVDSAGTSTARVELRTGPLTVQSNTTTYSTPESEFLATIGLGDVSPYGVGLFAARGTTDGCESTVWVRVSGRFALATLTGLTALGLTLGGITGQLGAVASRRRWARSAAAAGGIATGTGATVLGQQFGRLQLSYISLGGLIAAAAAVGLLLAWAFNPGLRRRRTERRLQTAESAVAAPVSEQLRPRPSPRPTTRVDEESAPAAPSTGDYDAESEGSAKPASAPEQAPAPPAGPFWCYVLAPTDLFDLTDHTKTVAVLEPGNWYLAKRTVTGWAHVVASDGTEGWVAEGAIHRQG